VKSAEARVDLTVSKKVLHLLGEQVLRLPKPSPRRPSVFASETKEDATDVAASTAMEVAVTEPRTTLSAYTLPEAPEPSP